MERLTKYSKRTSHENGICCTHFGSPECYDVGGNCAMNCKWEEAAWERLAAYEDSKYPPDKVAWAVGTIEMAFDEDETRITHMHDLAVADGEGRVVMLRFKIGNTAWYYNSDFGTELPYVVEAVHISREATTYEANCSHDGELLDSIDFEDSDVGKTVFCTQKELKEAMEAIRDGV